MLFDFSEIDARARHKLVISTVTPRPIAWVTSQDANGVLNAAPFSFFNAFSTDPPVIAVGVGSYPSSKGPRAKDTRANIMALGEFVVNLVSEELAQAMNITAIEFEPHVDELEQAGLLTRASTRVTPPRIADAPVSMECKLVQIVELGAKTGLVLGEIVAMHVRDDLVIDPAKYYVNTPKMKLIGRMHGAGWYARTSDLFEMPRIAVDEWRR